MCSSDLGPIAIVGASSTSAPAALKSRANAEACAAARVITTRRPASGRASIDARAVIGSLYRIEYGDFRGALREQRFRQPSADRLGILGRPGHAVPEARPAVLAQDDADHAQ